MNANIAVLPENRRFRISVMAVTAAMLLVGALQNIMFALLELLRPAAIHLIDLSIKRGHFDFFPVAEETITWSLVIPNLFIGIVGLCLSYWLANWSYARRSKV
jgi:hypothetical protein